MAFSKRAQEILEDIKRNLDDGVAEGSICFKPLIPGLHFDGDSQTGNQRTQEMEDELAPHLWQPAKPSRALDGEFPHHIDLDRRCDVQPQRVTRSTPTHSANPLVRLKKSRKNFRDS